MANKNDPQSDAREIASLYAIYDCVVNGNDPVQDFMVSKKTTQAINPEISAPGGKGIFPSLTDPYPITKDTKFNDVFTFQTIGPVFRDWLSQNKPTLKKKSIRVGIFDDGKVTTLKTYKKLMPQQTDIFNRIWNECFQEVHRNIVGGKKDTWNPADVYISTMSAGEEKVLMKQICDMMEKFDKADPKASVLLLNQSLRKYFNGGPDGSQFLIGISLKQATWPSVPTVKQTNTASDKDFETPKAGNEVKLSQPMSQWMQVTNKSDKGFLDFFGNSLTFRAEVSMDGGKPLKYGWESKSPTKTGTHATEMKDVVQTDLFPLTKRASKKGSPLGLASARTGSIPGATFRELIKEFTGEDVNHKIPLKDNDYLGKDAEDKGADVQYWADKLNKVMTDPDVKLRDMYIQCGPKAYKGQGSGGKFAGPNKKIGKTAYDWVWLCNKIDYLPSSQVQIIYGYPKAAKFKQNLRGKLRAIRYMEAIVNAKSQGRLGEFLIRAYYTAAKMKLKKDDVQGPFVKIASGA
tara:strand:- start:54 stop:1607 length:1554 start_codon:yes stop_codon:yes gene_type:complete